MGCSRAVNGCIPILAAVGAHGQGTRSRACRIRALPVGNILMEDAYRTTGSLASEQQLTGPGVEVHRATLREADFHARQFRDHDRRGI